jgi:hypothetical protein
MLKLSAIPLLVVSLCAANQALAQQIPNPSDDGLGLTADSGRTEKFAVEKTLSVGGNKVIIRAKQPSVDISVLLPKAADIRKMSSDQFEAYFDEARQTYFPDEEIVLEVGTSQVIPQAVNYALKVIKARRWNVTRSRGQNLDSAYPNTNGVSCTINMFVGTVRKYLYRRTGWVEYKPPINAPGRWADAFSGLPGTYGSRVSCTASSCRFDVITFVFY